MNNDVSTHQFYDLIRDRHTQTGTSIFLHRIGMFLIKRPENTLYISRIHTNTGITHADHQIHRILMQHHLTEGNDNLTF